MKKEKDYRWLNWLSWGILVVVAALLIWNFVTYRGVNFSTVHWVILAACGVAEFVIWLAKKKLQGDDN